ncbi:Tyrosine recombinase XerC [Streptomyces lavendulae subsp. lavendulae]|uniref:Tyrosine recombinase XerC n=1 Tax=Streptomyces lavendulae subsp. lavendulae TaxID=58340 RepID=A0A2K8PU07_STRLA|nr:Tyrosine recombinase XerC [Streptomyces lavendulae subsp. lavendulae]
MNPRTGKTYLRAGYAPATINHNLTVVSSFYAFHRRHNRGPLVNPVPESAAQRRALAHHDPEMPTPQFRRARLRQRVRSADPRAIPDNLWDELFRAMTHDQDRAAVLLYVSSGSRAGELLGVAPNDIDWSGQQIYVVTKGRP